MAKQNDSISNLNFDLLNENIRRYMQSANMSQKQLGALLGLAQSDISKRLNTSNKAQFTLEQIYIIANYFGTSIDSLVGNTPSNKDLSPKEICRILLKMIEKYQLYYTQIDHNDEVYSPCYDEEADNIEFKPGNASHTYNAFFFPNYFSTSEGKTDDDRFTLHQYACSGGNDLPKNMKINDFLSKYLDAFKNYEKGVFSQNVYDILVKAFLDEFPEE